MSLPLDARFGLNSGPGSLDGRELMLIQGALGAQRRYMRGLAERNRDPEAAAQNLLNAMEVRLLSEKLAQWEPVRRFSVG